MAFSALVEALNVLSRRARRRREKAVAGVPGAHAPR
jgi:hypothetical protein